MPSYSGKADMVLRPIAKTRTTDTPPANADNQQGNQDSHRRHHHAQRLILPSYTDVGGAETRHLDALTEADALQVHIQN